MAWNWQLGKIAGIRVQMNITFLILLAWVALSGLSSGGALGSLVSVVLSLFVFGVVVLHELGHALAARAFGIPTRDITLTPIGGVARLEGMPRKPIQEVIVAAAGPAVNFALAGLAALFIPVVPASSFLTASLLTWFIWMNLILAGFNLIPAFPMDGGRILRAALTGRYGRIEATAKAAKVARWMAMAMGIYGLATFQLTLVFIALFVWGTSSLELVMEKVRFISNLGQQQFQTRQREYGHPDNEIEVLDDPMYRGQHQQHERVTRVRFL